jgi:hypothetical protein
MQLQTVLYYTYNTIFVTIFRIKHKLYIAPVSSPPPNEKLRVCTCTQGNMKQKKLRQREYEGETILKKYKETKTFAIRTDMSVQ